jgi:hypothetical protein
MAAFAKRTNRRPGRIAAAKATRRRLPPSADLINFVLEHADLRDELGGGRVMLRLSPTRLAGGDLRLVLGDEAERAGDVAVIWDDREDEIFRVLDGGAPPMAAVAAEISAPFEEEPEELNFEDPDDEPQFVLTPSALQYLAESGSRRRW